MHTGPTIKVTHIAIYMTNLTFENGKITIMIISNFCYYTGFRNGFSIDLCQTGFKRSQNIFNMKYISQI